MTESFPALGSAAGKNLAAVSGSHPLAEAVLLLALPLFRLICANHEKYSLSFYSYSTAACGRCSWSKEILADEHRQELII
jgi:hypothetical protein